MENNKYKDDPRIIYVVDKGTGNPRIEIKRKCSHKKCKKWHKQ